ncbi:MAG: HAD family hydrolase [Rhodanobacter sp.]
MDLALFDFDGTITNRETMPDFMQMAVRPGRLWLGKILLLPLILAYKAKLVSGVVVRAAICLFGFWRVPAHELEAHGQRFAENCLPTVLRPEAMSRIAWHKARGDTVVVVSGGLDVYLRHWCREHGVELLCSTLERHNGKLTGRYFGHQCVRGEKARLVQEQFPLAHFAHVFAYGDTPEDRELLALAHEANYRWQPVPTTLQAGADCSLGDFPSSTVE